MNQTELTSRLSNIDNYFNYNKRWSRDSNWDLVYYKREENLQELRYVLDIAFGNELEIIYSNYEYDHTIIGGSIVSVVSIEDSLNMYSVKEDVYIKFTLCEKLFRIEQSDSADTFL